MPDIHPQTLRDLRNKRRWSQETLARESKVGRATIQRIEDSEGPRDVRNHTAEQLASKLGVEVADLARPPQEEGRSHPFAPMRRVGALVDGDKALGFDMVEVLYGISTRDQITMAPLLTTLMVEACRDWRRKQLDRIEALADEMRSLAGSHHAYQVAADKAEERVEDERAAIRARDVFGWDLREDEYGLDELGYDPERNTTFADFLREFAREVGVKTVTFHEDEDGSFDGLPSYDFELDHLDRITGGDRDALYAFKRGHVRFGDIPKTLLPDDQRDERVKWIVSRVPDDERAALQDWHATIDKIIEASPDTTPGQEPAP